MTGRLGQLPEPIRLAVPDVLQLGLLGVRTRPARAALSALGIALGIATMLVVTAIPASGQRALLAELSALGTNVLQAAPAPDPQTGRPTALPAESVDMVARIGPVQIASAVANTHVVVSRTDRDTDADVNGLTVLASRPNLLQALNAKLRTGRFLDRAMAAFPTTVLGSVAATRLGIAALPAPPVYIGGHWFAVVGILEPVPLAADLDRAVLVGWPAATSQLHFDGRPTVIYLQAVESRIEAVRAVLPATVDPSDPGRVLVTRPSDALAAKRATQHTYTGLFIGLAAVALLVGGVGVANTMVVSVLERRSEIGLRRALGATRGQIRGQFLTESVLLAGLGGVAGVLLGAFGTAAYTAFQQWPMVVPGRVVAAGLAGTVLVGLVAGAYPAVRAARLTPTEALSL